MPVPNTHRFLFGLTPETAEKRIWLIGDTQTYDLFFHNLYHGCVDLRRTLELWALEHGVDFTVFLDCSGKLDFSGNPDPVAARDLFLSTQPGRPVPSGFTPRSRDQPTRGSGPSREATQSRAQQAAQQTEDAIGGQGQGYSNTFLQLEHLLRNRQHPCLLIVEDLHEFIANRLEMNPAQIAVAQVLKHTIRSKWQNAVTASLNLVVFLAGTPEGMQFLEQFLPYKTVERKIIGELPAPEVEAALERLALRHNFRVNAPKAVAKTLARHGHLGVAMTSVHRVVKEDHEEVNVGNILRLPPVNERKVAEIKSELNDMVGLTDLKEKVLRLEQKARDFQRALRDGESELPDETLHMVFTGNAGTGKTTVANIVGRLFHALGLLRNEPVRYATASTLMVSHIGGTREKMHHELSEALGGVLFLDEAHDFGDKTNSAAVEAVQAIVPMSMNHRHEFVIILAGYESSMHDFYKMNDGLDRRFPPFNRIHFPDYSSDELWVILERKLARRGFSLDPSIPPRLRSVLTQRAKRQGFGNAGGVDNLMTELLENHTMSSSPQSKTLTAEALPPLVRRNAAVFDEAQAKLNKMVGINSVRNKIDKIINSIAFQLEEVEDGSQSILNLHPGNMLFVGAPGTGKTTVGHLTADLLYGLGAIDRRVCLTVTRGDLIAEFQGQSAARVRLAIEKARDGVLFVDEAYALALGAMDTFGNEAVTELVGQITNPENAGTVFILAGYEDAIDEFIGVNAGLSRRFGERIRFDNFSPSDCAELARRRLQQNNYICDPDVLPTIEGLAASTAAAMGEHFGNAGWVETLVDQSLSRMMTRIMRSAMPRGDVNRRRLEVQDLFEGEEQGAATAHGMAGVEDSRGAQAEPDEVNTDGLSGT